MKQQNPPKKKIAQFQVWTSVLLLIVAAILSFTPIFTLETSGNADDINEMLDEIAPELNIKFPDSVDVSAIKIAQAIDVSVKLAKVDMKSSQSVIDEELEAELEALIESDESKDTVIIALALVSSISSNFDDVNTEKQDTATGILVLIIALITLIALFTLLCFTFWLPIVILFSALTALISALMYRSYPEEVAPKISGKLFSLISLPFILMLFQCVIPGMTYGVGVAGICGVAILAAVLGLVVSRFRSYDASARRYLNILQGMSALGIVGFMVFFFNLVETGILSSFLRGRLTKYVASVSEVVVGPVNNGYLVDFALILVYVCLAMGSVAYLKKCVQRMTCSAKENKMGIFPKDTCIGRAILMIAVYAIPTYIMGAKHYYKDPTSTEAVGDASFLALDAVQKASLNMVLVGIIIMFAVEILLIVLKKALCPDIDDARRRILMSGREEPKQPSLWEKILMALKGILR